MGGWVFCFGGRRVGGWVGGWSAGLLEAGLSAPGRWRDFTSCDRRQSLSLAGHHKVLLPVNLPFMYV